MMKRKVIRGTEKKDKLTAGTNTDIYVGGGDDTVTLQGHINGDADGIHRIYVDNNDGKNDIYGFTNQDSITLINGAITDYGMKGNNIYLKNGKTTVWLHPSNTSTSPGANWSYTGSEVEVVYKNYQNKKNVSFHYWFANNPYTTFIYNPWDRYYGFASNDTYRYGQNILIASANSLKGKKNPDALSLKEAKNPHIDLRDTSKYQNINVVNAGDTKGAIVHGGKDYVDIYGSFNGADELWAGTGGAYLDGQGGSGTDTYHGSSGDDVFVHSGRIEYYGIGYDQIRVEKSNQIVYGYTSGQDDISYRSGYWGGMVSGRDVILNFNNGTMRLKDAVGKAIYMYSESDGEEYVRTFGTPVLAKGLSYQNNHQKLLVKAPFKGTIKSATYDSTVKEIDARTVKTAINIEGNPGSNLTIRAGQGGGTIYSRHGNDKLYGGKGVDVFLYRKKNTHGKDSHDTIYGYEAGRDIIRIEQDKYELSADGNDVMVKIGDPQFIWKNNMQVNLGPDSVRIVNGVMKNIIIEDGKGKRVTKKVYHNPPAFTSWNKKTAMVTFNSKTPATTFDAKNYDPTIRGMDGRSVNKRLNITGNGQNNTIYAGKAGGVLSGMGGNDTLYGGNGVDTFRYTSGADTIVNYQAGRDVIQLAAGSITAHKVWGSDVTLNIGKGKILVKDGVNKKILVKDAKGKTKAYQYGYLNLPSTSAYDKTKTKVTMKANAKGNFESTGYAPKIVTIDAKAAKAAMNIYGNAKNNTIYASNKGGILQGRGGSDTLYGGTGKDTFVYANGDGNDVINSYTPNQDVIKLLSGKIDSYRLSGKDVMLHIGKGTIRVKNAMNKKITFADAKGKTYNRTYSNVIRAGKSGGRLRGNGVDDIFYGNAGTDTFVYGAGDGNMTIYDYASGRDIIYLEAGTVKGWTSKGNDALINVGAKTITIKDGMNRKVIVQKKNGEKYTFLKGTKHARVLADGVTYDTDKKLVYLPERIVYTTSVSGKDLLINDWLSGKTYRIAGMGNSPVNILDSYGKIKGYWKNNSLYDGYYDVARKAVIMHSDSTSININNIPIGYHIIDARNSKEYFNFYGTAQNEVFYGGQKETSFSGNGGTDIFYGGKGKDTFNFSSSVKEYDTVYNYEKNKDQIYFNDDENYEGYIVKGHDVIFKYKNGTMTIKNAAPKDIKVQNDTSGNWRKKRIFVYGTNSGNMTINDYVSGQSTIYLENGNIKSWTANGNDAILSVGKNTITIKNGLNYDVMVKTKNGREYAFDKGTKTTIYLDNDNIKSWTANGNDAILSVGKNTITIKNGLNYDVIVKTKSGVEYEFAKGTKHAQILGKGVIYDTDKKLVYMQEGDDISYTAVSGKDLLVKTDIQEFRIPGMGNTPVNIMHVGTITGYWGNDKINDGYFDFVRKAIVTNCDWANLSLTSSAIPDGYHILDARNSKGIIYLSGTNKNDKLYGGKDITEFRGYGGTDEFYGGTGKDVFRFVENDYETCHYTVFNYDKTRDQISLGDYYDGYIVKGKDVIFKYYDSTMTVKNVTAKDVNIDGDAAGKWRKDLIIPAYLKYEKREDTRAAVLDSSFSGNSIDNLKVLSDTKIVDASKVKSYMKMDDVNDRFSTLIAGQGGSQLRVYKGGKTLVGGAGKDSFEVALKESNGYIIDINNYEKRKDKIKITGNLQSASESDNWVSLYTSNGFVNVNGAKLSDLTVYDSSHSTKPINFGDSTSWDSWDQTASSLMISSNDKYISDKKNTLSYLSQLQSVGSAKENSLMHLSNKTNSNMSNITLASHGQSARGCE